MFRFFHWLEHGLGVAVHELDHATVATLHFIDTWVDKKVTLEAITALQKGVTQFTTGEQVIIEGQVREFAASTVASKFPAMARPRVYALVGHLMDVATAKANGLEGTLLDHLFAHYTAAVTPSA